MLDYLQKDSPKLSGLNFAVCGLGDTSFHHFAQCGKDFEKALLACSAKAMFDRVDCDEDYEVSFDAFKESAVSYLRENKDSLFNPESASSNETDPAAAAATTDFTEAKVGGAERVHQAKLLEKVLLSKPGSAKETMHYERTFDSETGYRAGDCFAVDPENSARVITSVLTAAQMTGDEMVSWRGETIPLREALQSACLQQVTLELVRLVAKQPGAGGEPSCTGSEPGKCPATAFSRNTTSSISSKNRHEPNRGECSHGSTAEVATEIIFGRLLTDERRSASALPSKRFGMSAKARRSRGLQPAGSQIEFMRETRSPYGL